MERKSKRRPRVVNSGHGIKYSILAKHVRIANLVVLPLPVRVVGRAITFPYQAGFAAVEVGDITAELMLAPEFEALQLSITK